VSVDAGEVREAPSSAFSFALLPQGQLATVTDTPLHFFQIILNNTLRCVSDSDESRA
jgi:hypothetical protein